MLGPEHAVVILYQVVLELALHILEGAIDPRNSQERAMAILGHVMEDLVKEVLDHADRVPRLLCAFLKLRTWIGASWTNHHELQDKLHAVRAHS